MLRVTALQRTQQTHHLTSHGVQSVHATEMEIRRDGVEIGRVARWGGPRSPWYWHLRPQRTGWSYHGMREKGRWNGPYKRMREAVEALDKAEALST